MYTTKKLNWSLELRGFQFSSLQHAGYLICTSVEFLRFQQDGYKTELINGSHSEQLSVDWRIILKCVLREKEGYVEYVHRAQIREV